MEIDWLLAGKIAGPVTLLFIGAWINRLFERRAVLISYYVHASACRVTPTAPAVPFVVHTHAVALKNDGKLPATNVRLHHFVLPDFTIAPAIPHSIETMPDGSKDIVIPRVLPNEQLTITYLYFPPLLYSGINAGIRSDQGFARAVPALMQRQYPKWVNYLAQILLVVGAIALAYLLWVAGRAAWHCLVAS